jgi:glycolate oxidase FAD binding subunit
MTLGHIVEEFSARIRQADSEHPLRLRAGGTKDFYGQALTGEVLDTRPYAGVVAYEPSELVITVRCGTPLSEVEAALRANGQWLAFEPPRFGPQATAGGVVAAGLSGPARFACGAVRDFVLGARVMNAQGEVLTFGGQVMKNVAGYDLSRLLTGSLGTLGLILEVSLKVVPSPPATASLRFELPPARAIESLNQWGGRPLPLTGSVYTGGELTVRLAGSTAAVTEARGQLGGMLLTAEEAERFWLGVREHTDAFFAGGLPLWRISVPSRTAPLQIPGKELIEWGGAQRWLVTGADARTVREAAARCGGHATLFRGGDKTAGVFHPLTPAIAGLHRRLKDRLDPQRIFNPGRMYADV